tara:strand:+ start:475 stop:1254 length:780 start_codon:yes stop_codon:yes gene_type:complete
MSDQDKPKEPEQIIDEQSESVKREYLAPSGRLFASSLTAGLEIGFSVLLMGILYTMFSDDLNTESLSMVTSLGYPLGFIFVIIGRSELFTEQTALAMIPVLQGKTKVYNLLRLWGLVIFGNLLGGLLFSLFITWIGPARGFIDAENFYHLAEKVLSPGFFITLGSAILAGWMMGLLGWLVTSSQESMARIFIVFFVTVIIGLGHLHHCIVGSVEVICGMLTSDQISFRDYLDFLVPSVLGNTVGGAIFVSVLKFSQVSS